jgi:hypothetical protein
MNFLIDNWYLFIVVLALGFVIGCSINTFLNLPNK